MNSMQDLTGAKIDLTKFILAILVVMLHILDHGVFAPLFRCAVPLFFIISSYLFFKRLQTKEERAEKDAYFLKYIKRNLQLYLFWFILLFPATLMFRDYFDNGILSGILVMLKGFIFSSTFPASWYIMASVIGVGIIYFFSVKLKISNVILLFISLITYAFCIMGSNYYNVLKGIDPIYNFYSSYVVCFSVPYNSFPVSLIWILIGKYISEHNIKFDSRIIIVMFVISGLLLWFEYALVKRMEFSLTDDCFIMLPPFCFFMSVLLSRLKINWGGVCFQKLRNMSTIIYCSHLTIAFTIRYLLTQLNMCPSQILLFIMTLSFAIILSLMIIKLREFKYMEWLKFAY